MIGIALALLSLGSVADSAPQRQAEIIHLLKHDCGSCHGMSLQGGLGPALNPERLKPFTAEQLAATILYGRPGTPMPPWKPFLSEQEALWLASLLKEGIRP
jgi:cytochrome c55X